MQDITKVLKDIMKSRKVNYDFETLYQAALNDVEVQDFIKQNQAYLRDDAISKSAANIYEFVTQRDIVLNNEKSTVNGYQPVLVVNDGLIDVSYKPTKETMEAQAAKRRIKKVSFLDMPKMSKDADLNKFEADAERVAAIGAAFEFVNGLVAEKEIKGIYFSGDFGVGKTYLLSAIANSLAQKGFSVTILHVPSFISDLSSHFADNSLHAEIQKLKTVDVLMLDDIGAETLSQWSRDDVLGVILQARMENILPTLFSSNLSMEALQDHFAETKNAAEPVKAARIMERIKFLAREVEVGGPNRRNG